MARRTDLRKLRDKKIVEVFHQLSDIERMKIDDAYTLMEQEIFFIDSSYIHKLIFYNKENKEYYQKLLSNADSNKIIQTKLKNIKKQLKLL